MCVRESVVCERDVCWWCERVYSVWFEIELGCVCVCVLLCVV